MTQPSANCNIGAVIVGLEQSYKSNQIKIYLKSDFQILKQITLG
jgi:hypothetical protein